MLRLRRIGVLLRRRLVLQSHGVIDLSLLASLGCDGIGERLITVQRHAAAFRLLVRRVFLARGRHATLRPLTTLAHR